MPVENALTEVEFYRDPVFWTYLAAALVLTVLNIIAWAGNLFSMPGNWLVVLLTALFAWQFPERGSGLGLGWVTVAWLVGLAAVGELVEFASGAAGAAKQGASRRAVALSLVGAFVGSIFGATVGIPIPVIGPLVGAVGGGALGAFGGAYLGESWRGTHPDARFEIGVAALWGRLFGTLGKIAIGAIMVAVATIAAFV